MGKIVAKRANGDYRQWSGVSLEVKDHEKRELVSELVGIARIAHGTEQLRDRIAYALSGVFSALDEATARAERSEAELKAAREQEPVAWRVRGQLFRFASDAILFHSMNTVCGGVVEKLYASPIPAPAAQVPQEPVATVYIGSGHCKVAFTNAAKEAMKGRQGQSFDVYAEPMPRAVKESLTVESVAAQVPQEWRDFAASVAENKLLQPDCVCERCEWTRKAIALLHEVKP